MLDLPYIVEVQIGLAVLWTGYRTFLSGQSFFARNRAFLLGSSVAAWIFPLLSIPVWTPETSVQDVTLGAAAVADALPSGAETDGLRKLALYILWFAGAGFVLGRFVRSGVKLWRTVRRAEVERHGNIRFFRPSVPVGSFSFFHRIWIEEPAGDRGRLSEIIAHERGHVSSGHSWDRLWAAALCAVLWWSPFVWMWSRSLREVHEYQADRAALDRGFDSRQYIILMLRQSTDLHPELVSGFGHSLIKKRLVMISRFSPRRAKFRILLSLPLVALLMALVSFTAVPASGADRPSGSGAADSVRAVAGPGSERSDRVYERPEVMPEFPGDAPNALMSWIAGHLKYPAEAAEKGISGNGRLPVRRLEDRSGPTARNHRESRPVAQRGSAASVRTDARLEARESGRCACRRFPDLARKVLAIGGVSKENFYRPVNRQAGVV